MAAGYALSKSFQMDEFIWFKCTVGFMGLQWFENSNTSYNHIITGMNKLLKNIPSAVSIYKLIPSSH